MRIALFHNMMTGGALRSTQNQLKRLRTRHEIDCYALSCSADEGRALSEWCGATHVYEYTLHAQSFPKGLGPTGWLLDLKRMKSLQRKVAEEIEAGSYDLFITCTCAYFEIPSIIAYLGVPSVYINHSARYPALPGSGEGEKRSLNPAARHFEAVLQREKTQAIASAGMVLANSFFSREELFRLYGVNSYVRRDGVDTNGFRPMPDCERTKAVLGVGALAPFKAHDFTIRSIARIPPPVRPELWIAHHTEVTGEKERLVQLAARLGVKMRLFENVDTDGLCRMYNSVAAVSFPSYFEPLGLVPLESMACGTPVVGVAEGGIRETVVDGETGILTNRDEEEFGQAILRLLEQPGLARQMGVKAREHVVRRWDCDVVVNDLEALLEKAACRKPSTAPEGCAQQ